MGEAMTEVAVATFALVSAAIFLARAFDAFRMR